MSDDTHRAALQPGHLVQWYEVRRILGQGGFGITYLAHDRNLDQDVAIKEYLPLELAVRDTDQTVQPVSGNQGEQYRWGLERFIVEARTLAQFKHPNIVRVLSVFEANNTAYMVMEYEHGDSLGSRLKGRGTLDETELLAVVLPLLGGLEQVHAAGFIHRDIKPPNIFLREDGSPVLLDFGSARQATGQQTRALTALVSPGYAPFEQYHSGSEEQGPWTDIYGLAATMYRAIAGTPPVDAVDRSRSLLDSNRDYLVTAAEIGKGVYSERLLRAIDHGLAFRPRERPRSIAEWRADFGIEDHLETVRRVEALEEAPTVPADRAGAPTAARPGGAAPPTARDAAARPAPAAEKRGSGAIVALGLAAALIAGAGVWWMQMKAGEGTGAPPAESLASAADAAQPSRAAASSPARAASDSPAAAGAAASAESSAGPVGAPVAVPGSAAPPRPEIAQHLERAAAQRAAGQLLAPAGDNALASYRAVLEMDPGNESATRGVRGIQTGLLAAADTAIDAGDLASARSRIGYAELVDADSAQLGITRIRLREAERRAAAGREREAAAAREREAAAERERLAAEERRRQEEERERQAAAERERQAALERERSAAAERERLAALERDREAAAERERQAAAERKRQAAAALEGEAAAERERLAAVAAKRDAELAQCRGERGRVPAEPPRAGSGTLYFAAIAIGDDYGWGEAYGFENQAEAESLALANCRKNVANCAMEVWTNDCIALARGVDGAAGWAWGASVREAGRKALKVCEGHDPCCRVTRSYCADELAR